MSTEIEQLVEACAYVETRQTRGTAYLVRSDMAVTSFHVVKTVAPDEKVRVRFPNGECEAGVEYKDELADCAILRLENAPKIQPLRLAENSFARDHWISYGFPAIAGKAGVLIEGDLRNPQATDTRGGPALQLFSPDAAAGKGALLQGFSGAPVFVRGALVGHLNWILPDAQGAAQLGLIYACPVAYVAAQLPPGSPLPPRSPQPPGAAYDPTWYVHREQEEEDATNWLNRSGAPCVLWGPELMGKTTLMQALLNRVRQEDLQEGKQSRVIEIDLQRFPGQAFDSPEELLHCFALHLAEELAAPDDWVANAWKRPGGGKAGLSRLVQQALNWQEGRFIIVIESTDLLMKHNLKSDSLLKQNLKSTDLLLKHNPMTDEFFSLLRSWVENKRTPWPQLRLLLPISTTPTRFAEDIALSSFFNTAQTIRMEDFNRMQVERLADLYSLAVSEQEIDLLMSLVGGHPFLVRKAMYTAVKQRISLADLLGDWKRVERVFADHLLRIETRLIQQSRLDIICQILTSPEPYLNDEDKIVLSYQGLVQDEDNRYVLRYNLYKRYFEQVCRRR